MYKKTVANSPYFENNSAQDQSSQQQGHILQSVLNTPRIQIHQVQPSEGPVQGNNRVAIFGEFYKPASQQIIVYFGLIPSPKIEYMDFNRIVCTAPSRLITGTVSVTCVIDGKTIGNSMPYTYIEGANSNRYN